MRGDLGRSQSGAPQIVGLNRYRPSGSVRRQVVDQHTGPRRRLPASSPLAAVLVEDCRHTGHQHFIAIRVEHSFNWLLSQTSAVAHHTVEHNYLHRPRLQLRANIFYFATRLYRRPLAQRFGRVLPIIITFLIRNPRDCPFAALCRRCIHSPWRCPFYAADPPSSSRWQTHLRKAPLLQPC